MSDNENDKNGQVINLDEKRAAKAPTGYVKGEQKAIIMNNIVEDMVTGRFHKKYATWTNTGGEILCFEISDTNEVREVCKSDVTTEMSRYFKEIRRGGSIILKGKDYKDAFDTFENDYRSRIDTYPKSITLTTDNSLAFKKINLDKTPFDCIDQAFEYLQKKAPCYSEFISRCSDKLAVSAFIGSILEEKSDRSQYLWFYGEGKNGKSALVRFFINTLGVNACSDCKVPVNNDKFWTGNNLVGKRLAIFDDITEYSFVKTGLFKSLTGNKWMNVERKFGKAGMEPIDAKFMFTSNDKPMNHGGMADLRRAICVNITPLTNPNSEDPELDSKWLTEADAIYRACYFIYRSHCPNFGIIKANMDMLNDIVDDNNEHYEFIFDKNFVYTGKPEDFVKVTSVVDVLIYHRKYQNNGAHFYSFLKNIYKIEKTRERVAGKQIRIIRGIKPKITLTD